MLAPLQFYIFSFISTLHPSVVETNVRLLVLSQWRGWSILSATTIADEQAVAICMPPFYALAGRPPLLEDFPDKVILAIAKHLRPGEGAALALSSPKFLSKLTSNVFKLSPDSRHELLLYLDKDCRYHPDILCSWCDKFHHPVQSCPEYGEPRRGRPANTSQPGEKMTLLRSLSPGACTSTLSRPSCCLTAAAQGSTLHSGSRTTSTTTRNLTCKFKISRAELYTKCTPAIATRSRRPTLLSCSSRRKS